MIQGQDFSEISQKSCFLFTSTSKHDIVVVGIQEKGCEYMEAATRSVKNRFVIGKENSVLDTSILKEELSKGMQSVRKGEVYTLEEAWKEIDAI